MQATKSASHHGAVVVPCHFHVTVVTTNILANQNRQCRKTSLDHTMLCTEPLAGVARTQFLTRQRTGAAACVERPAAATQHFVQSH